MTRTCNRADQIPLALRDPHNDEAGRSRAVPVQELEQRFNLQRDPGLEAVPGGTRDVALERRDLKLFFYVDREMVANHDRQRCNGRA